jgi:hypothetical protein
MAHLLRTAQRVQHVAQAPTIVLYRRLVCNLIPYADHLVWAIVRAFGPRGVTLCVGSQRGAFRVPPTKH